MKQADLDEIESFLWFSFSLKDGEDTSVFDESDGDSEDIRSLLLNTKDLDLDTCVENNIYLYIYIYIYIHKYLHRTHTSLGGPFLPTIRSIFPSFSFPDSESNPTQIEPHHFLATFSPASRSQKPLQRSPAGDGRRETGAPTAQTPGPRKAELPRASKCQPRRHPATPVLSEGLVVKA